MRSYGMFMVSALSLMGCGSSTMTTARYAQASGDEQAWAHLLPGRRVVLYAPAGVECGAKTATSLAELRAGGSPIAKSAGARVLEIVDSEVEPTAGFVTLALRDREGSSTWLQLPTGQRSSCVVAAPPDIDKVVALTGKKLMFAPWRDECRAVAAVGEAPSAMLIDAEPGLEFVVDGFALGPRGVAGKRANQTGGTPWLVMNGGTIQVRSDVVETCFGPAGTRAPKTVTSLVRLPAGRCSESTDGQSRHVECRSTLGIWSGTVSDTEVDLAAVRRTLGAVHFLDGRPISGARYAKAVVAVTQGAAPDPRGHALNQALDAAVRRAIDSDSSGSVRISDPNAADVTYRVHVEVQRLSIGALERFDTTAQSEYKIRDEIRDNPAKPRARERAALARDRLQDEQQSYANELQLWEKAKQAAIDECRRQANKVDDDTTRTIARTGCDVASIAGQFVKPSDSGVVSARSELTAAETDLANTPDTITVPIMGTWTYPKTVYRRSTSATLRLTMQSVNQGVPSVVPIHLSHVWEDYEVAADAPHNVKGHRPDPRPIQSDDALVPFVAEKASGELAVRLRAALSQAAVEEAKRAFAAAGHAAPKPGFEAVDAIAFEVAGGRLQRAVLRGEAALGPNAAFALPVRSASASTPGCVLAVAVAASGSATDLQLTTADASAADLRGGSLAVVEACGDDARSLKDLALSSKLGGDARWGLYVTRSEERQ